MLGTVTLVRHGETEWSASGRHTGRTDVPLTGEGERKARRLEQRLAGGTFDRVLASPLERAARTCALAGFGDAATLDPDLVEWDYGTYEGRKTSDILAERPGWLLFRDGCPGGEQPSDIGRRADRVVAGLRAAGGRTLLFSSGHFLRVLAARWLGLPPTEGRLFALDTASVSLLAYEHDSRDEPRIALWNEVGPPGPRPVSRRPALDRPSARV